MKILFFGDVFGKPGRQAVKAAILKLVPEHTPDFIVVNAENAAHGKGITEGILKEFFDMGVDVITTGNHAWDQPDSAALYARYDRLLRPLNYAESDLASVPGKGVVVIAARDRPNIKLAVVLLMGRVFMDPLDCPFHRGHREIQKLKAQGIKNILIDFHGEASSEKQAFAFFVDGQVSAVLGTHSHVQTADERILAGGTAAITDVGMSGCFDSVIGTKKEISIKKFLTKMPVRFEPAEGPGGYGAVVVEVDEKTGKAKEIIRYREAVIKNGMSL
ncbi:MAG: TIGR00282 family metallophosphoesterase [Bdellovibrionales bacterium]|nr:TIGR00282 family metallophosphoesterase [Bdellovibrionales bacterium]